MVIEEASKRCGVKMATIRYYEVEIGVNDLKQLPKECLTLSQKLTCTTVRKLPIQRQ